MELLSSHFIWEFSPLVTSTLSWEAHVDGVFPVHQALSISLPVVSDEQALKKCLSLIKLFDSVVHISGAFCVLFLCSLLSLPSSCYLSPHPWLVHLLHSWPLLRVMTLCFQPAPAVWPGFGTVHLSLVGTLLVHTEGDSWLFSRIQYCIRGVGAQEPLPDHGWLVSGSVLCRLPQLLRLWLQWLCHALKMAFWSCLCPLFSHLQ